MRSIYRLSIALTLVAVIIGCAESPPDGITVESEGDMPWAYPDTVSVMVIGEDLAGEIRWERPDEVEKKWLDKHDYAHDRLEFDEQGTEILQEKDVQKLGMDAMAQRYYVRVE